MPSVDRKARTMHGNRAERAPHVLSQSGPLSGVAPEGSTSGAFLFATPRPTPASCACHNASAIHAVATRVTLSPRPRGSSAVPASPPTDVAAREETYRAALGQRAPDPYASGVGIRRRHLPRAIKPMTLDDQLAGLAVLAAVLGSIGFTIYSIVQKALT